MSCNRYHLWAALDVHAFSKAEAVLRFSAEEDGIWVQWQDYARLEAEVERLEAEVKRLNVEVDILRASSFVTAVSVEQYERVVKAGDAMAGNLDRFLNESICDCDWLRDGLSKWNAAKEGKPSV